MKRKGRKEEIFKIAARLFREKGYAAASIRDIAERVGLEPSSLYSHIKSKEEILVAICMDTAERFAEGMDNIRTQHNDPVLQLDALLDLHIDIAQDHPVSVTVFNDEWKHLPSEIIQNFKKIRKEYQMNFMDIIRSGMDDSKIHNMTPKTAFNLVINSVKWIHYTNKELSTSEIQTRREEIKSFVRKGLQIKS